MITQTKPQHLILVERLIALRAEKSRLAEEVKLVGQEEEAVERTLLDWMAAHGMPSFKTDDGQTVSRSTKLWARPLPGASDDEKQRNRGAVAQALTEYGLDFLIKSDFDVRSLSSWVKETRANGEEVPEGLVQVLQIVEEPEIRITGGSRRSK